MCLYSSKTNFYKGIGAGKDKLSHYASDSLRRVERSAIEASALALALQTTRGCLRSRTPQHSIAHT